MLFLKSRTTWLIFIFLGSFLLVGCGAKTPSSLESNVNGYQCQQCRLKFYTGSDVWPQVCPGCKASSPIRVAGLVCPKDNHMNIPELGGNANCGKCGEKVEAVKAPTEAELQAWGAVKKTQAEVSGQ